MPLRVKRMYCRGPSALTMRAETQGLEFSQNSCPQLPQVRRSSGPRDSPSWRGKASRPPQTGQNE